MSKKSTGPGKIDTTITPPRATVGGVVALLFNFGFDDATVKPEHQAFLLEHFVPPLAAAPGLRVFLRGTASQAGNADYNLQLSRRRVEAVRQFLVGKGVGLAQVVTTFTGENLSTSLSADDERDRAVEAILEASIGRARFDRVIPVEALDGFHGKGKPQGMVVGTQEVSFVRLLGARGSLVESLVPGVVRVTDPLRPRVIPVVATSDNMLLQLNSGQRGQGHVVARLPGRAIGSVRAASLMVFEGLPTRPEAKLAVASVVFKRVSVSFHYVTGPPKQQGVTTRREMDRGFEERLINVMNVIYVGQARILFRWHSQREVTTEFSGPINFNDPKRSDKALIEHPSTKNIDNSARIRVFFVGMLEGSPDSVAHTIREKKQSGSNVFIRDFVDPGEGSPPLFANSSAVGITLAHECGHCFAIEHDERDKRHLMNAENNGFVIPPDTAQEMHKHVVIP